MKRVDEALDVDPQSMLEFADFKTKHARKALSIGIVLLVLAVYADTAAYVAADSILAQNFIIMNAQLGRLVVIIVTVLGTNVSMQLVDRFGRKVNHTKNYISVLTIYYISVFRFRQILIIVSAGVTSLALAVYCVYRMAVYSHAGMLMDLIPTISSILAVFFASLGIKSLAFTVCTEIIPEKIKDVAVTLCGAFYWILSSILMVMFVFMGLTVVLPVTAIICLTGAISIHLWMPETKGKSRQEILKSL